MFRQYPPMTLTLALGLGIAYVFDFVMRSLRGYFLDVAGKQIDVILLAAIFEQILGLRSAVRPRSVGSLANNLQALGVDDVDVADDIGAVGTGGLQFHLAVGAVAEQPVQ